MYFVYLVVFWVNIGVIAKIFMDSRKFEIALYPIFIN